MLCAAASRRLLPSLQTAALLAKDPTELRRVAFGGTARAQAVAA